MFKEYKGLDLTGLSTEVLESWKKQDVFHKTLEMRESAPEYVFFEGPPSANGMSGIHHVMARSIKDVICRYKTQSGYHVSRKAGWDSRREVMKYTKEWVNLTERIGYWVDTDNPYITYDNRYIETLWYLLKEIYKKGLLYKGYSIQPYSPAAGTGLSTHELNQPGCYRDVKDTTAVPRREGHHGRGPV